MTRRLLILTAFTMGMAGCASKPRPQAQVPPGPGLSNQQVSVPVSAKEDTRAKVEALLKEAFRTIYFTYDRATLSEAAKSKLALAGKSMQQESSIKVLILGHTDERGSAIYNLSLGERRARAAKESLVNYGVSADRLELVSYGEEKPAKEGRGEAEWAANRRDDFQVTF